MVKELREKTGAGVMDCKRALAEASGDLEKAVVWLREKGIAAAAKRAGRVASEGSVGSYIHAGGKIGVLVEVNCETDFVAKTPEFQALVKEIAMQVAAANPRCVQPRGRARRGHRAGASDLRRRRPSGKPAAVVAKIVEGKLEKFYSEVVPASSRPTCAIPTAPITDLIGEYVAKMGEKIEVRRFVALPAGRGLDGKAANSGRRAR